MLRSATSKTRLIAMTGLVAAACAGIMVWRTDILLSRGFGKALQTAHPSLSFSPAAAGIRPAQPVAGDEGFWLARSDMQSAEPFAKPLALGDRITISGSDGRERRLEVVDLKAIEGTMAVRTGPSGSQARLLLVTCSVLGDGGTRGEGVVRFVVEGEPIAPAATPAAKSL